MAKTLQLAAPLASFERMKRALFIVSYLAIAELADPRPFHTGLLAKVLYLILVLEIIRQFVQYRLEISHGAIIQRRALRARWHLVRDRLSSDTRYKLRRIAIIVGGLYAFGLLLSSMTDRCDSAFQCAVLFPRLALENLPMALQVAFYIAMGLSQMAIMMWALTKVGFIKIILPGTIEETFDDVWGQDSARDKVMEQVELLNDDLRLRKAGGEMPKGILLWGPPGTGKTLLAKAAANASTKPLVLVPPGAFASPIMGINFLKVFILFKTIRKFAIRHDGVIVFFDEIDSLGHRGGEVTSDVLDSPGSPPPCAELPALLEPAPITNIISGSQDSGTLTAFLAAMDGMAEPRGILNKLLALAGFRPLAAPNYRYLILGATNRPNAIDPALLRAGRLGRKIRVGFPKYPGRIRTYLGYLAKVPLHTLADEEIEWMARNHFQGTGAEIKDIVNEAILLTFRDDDVEDGAVGFKHLTNAMLYRRYGETEGTFEVPMNVHGVAVHEASHALAVHYLMRDRVNIWIASIEQRGQTGGMVIPSPKDDDWKQNEQEMRNGIQVSLASRVGERLLLGYATNGHGGDGRSATDAARVYILMGHHDTVSTLVEKDDERFVQAIEEVMSTELLRVEELLVVKQRHLKVIAMLLERDHTVSGAKIHKILDWLDERYPDEK